MELDELVAVLEPPRAELGRAAALDDVPRPAAVGGGEQPRELGQEAARARDVLRSRERQVTDAAGGQEAGR